MTLKQSALANIGSSAFAKNKDTGVARITTESTSPREANEINIAETMAAGFRRKQDHSTCRTDLKDLPPQGDRQNRYTYQQPGISIRRGSDTNNVRNNKDEIRSVNFTQNLVLHKRLRLLMRAGKTEVISQEEASVFLF